MAEYRKQITNPDDIIPVVGFGSSEQEVTISTTRDEDVMSIYVSDNTFLTKIKKILAGNSKNWKCWMIGRDSGPTGYIFETKKKYLTIRSKDKDLSTLSEEKQLARQSHMAKMRAAKKRNS